MLVAEKVESISHSETSTRNEETNFYVHGEVEQALRTKGYQCLRGIEISVYYRVAFLRGHVPSFHMKQVAQTAARVVPGVCEVRNELNVVCPR